MSSGRRSSLMSGWRRITPVAEHGTSSRMRSKGRPIPPVGGLEPHRRPPASPDNPRRRSSSGDPRQALGRTSTATSCAKFSLQSPAGVRSCRPARRRRRARDARARLRRPGAELRRGVLHRDVAVRETGQNPRHPWRPQAAAPRREHAGGDVRCRSPRAARDTARRCCGAIDAQPQRRSLIVSASRIAAACSPQSARAHPEASADARRASRRRDRLRGRAARARAGSGAGPR